MKKFIIAELCLLFSFALHIYLFVTRLNTAINYLTHPSIPNIEQLGINCLVVACLCFVAIISNLIAMVLFALKDTSGITPLLDKLTKRKQKHAQAKAERADRAKQAKIAELEQQLEELKKDE